MISSVPDSGVGWLGGGQAGCNLQWRAFVIGVEGEVWGSTLYDRFFDQTIFFTTELQARNRWDAALSVRSGVDYDALFTGTFSSTTTTGSATITGVLIGVGFEYALTDNWTTKFEYNYIDYGNKIVDFTETECIPGLCATGTFRQTVKEQKQIAKLGLNYKFGYVGKDPVVRAGY